VIEIHAEILAWRVVVVSRFSDIVIGGGDAPRDAVLAGGEIVVDGRAHVSDQRRTRPPVSRIWSSREWQQRRSPWREPPLL
jgi:hypothetical protein